jgi:radical SAM protein with 4Fe4S-binding SPASM domain
MPVRINDYKTYVAVFNTETGEFLRKEKPNHPEPKFSLHGPELADIHITDYCPLHCSYCYRESDPSKSRHMSPSNFAAVLDAMSPHVFQVAIGGGSPQHHPEFIEILRIAHDKGIPPSYTSNGLDMTDEIIEATKRYAGAVAISMHERKTALKEVERLLEAGIEPAIHVVLDRKSIDEWAHELDIAAQGEGIFGGRYPLYSCICLMHKPIGRGSWEQHPHRDQKARFVKALRAYKGKVSIGIDSCFSPSLISTTARRDLPKYTLGPCDSGCFSVFVGEDLTVSPCSFNLKDKFNLNDHSFKEIWEEKLQPYREMVTSACPGCDVNDLCHSCHVLPGINPCDKTERTI